jgi:hypothetical protein
MALMTNRPSTKASRVYHWEPLNARGAPDGQC